MNVLKKKIVEKAIKDAFSQGNGDKYIILKAIIGACEDEYTEDNYSTRMSAIVSWLLQADLHFQVVTKGCGSCDEEFVTMMKKVMEGAVEDAVKGF